MTVVAFSAFDNSIVVVRTMPTKHAEMAVPLLSA